MGIRGKILTFALLGTLLPSLSLGLLAYLHDKRVVQAEARAALESVAGFTSRELDLWLRERIYDLRSFGSSFIVFEGLQAIPPQPAGGGIEEPVVEAKGTTATQRLGVFLQSVQQRMSYYEHVLAIAADGRMIASSAEQADAIELPPDWSAQAVAKGVVVAATYWKSAEDRPVLMLAVPIFSAQGELVGSLAATLDPDSIGQVLRMAENSAAGEVALMDARGRVLVSSDQVQGKLGSVSLAADVLKSLRAGNGQLTTYRNARGKRMLGALYKLEELPLLLVAQRKEADVFRELRELLDLFLTLIGGLVLSVGVIAYLFGLSIVRPLRGLIQGAEKIAGGDLGVDLPVTSGDEVGYLTRVFNQMTIRLRENRDQINAVNRDLKKKNQMLEEISATDALTGLRNRKDLFHTLQSRMANFKRYQRPFSVLLLDIDHFKQLNDVHGHLAGDQVLRAVAAILRHSIRGVDYAARFGGEEFLILLAETTRPRAMEAAERIRACVAAEAVVVDGQPLSVTISIGVAQAAQADSDPNHIVQRADRALYDAKRGGRNQVRFATGDPQPA